MALAIFAIEGKSLQKKLKNKPTKEIENYCALRKKISFCSENFDWINISVNLHLIDLDYLNRTME